LDIRTEISKFIDRDLITIQKPGRYVGGEFNQIFKDWENIRFHVALAFPDIYDIGFPNLGLAALYNIINNRSDALAERVFAPWFDMENILREKDIPLFSLESKTPISDFDLVGFTLPYETLYTNALNMLDLSGIPILTSKRRESDPIIIAGGHATYNPEPMHAFFDAFVIGEGEIIINELIDCILENASKSRIVKLQELSAIPGIYVPSTVPMNGDGKVDKTLSIKKRFLRKIDRPIQNFLVPNISVVHDRIAVEIMRGCSHGCRFCQAGMIMRPVRELDRTKVTRAIKESIIRTGISEISLLSLSTSDHSKISDILDDVNQLSEEYQLDFSLPSLRIESFGQNMMDRMQSKRKGNFTIAPEAGSEPRRMSINKPIPKDNILETVKQICSKGWNNIKLYFMIGFPGETDDDIYGIIDLCREIKGIGNKISKGRLKLHVSINTLIPKSHTPYQWVPLEKKDVVDHKYSILRDGLRRLKIQINYPDYDLIMLEALLSRGDRSLSDLIYKAWEKGAKFDAWNEGFSREIWHNAINEVGIDLNNYLYQERDIDHPLPWDFIDTGIEKSFLKNEYLNSVSGELTPGCFEKCSACGVNRNLQIDCARARIGEA
jgi:radical SAM family uncharacterized protein